jgi:hypothetical protein
MAKKAKFTEEDDELLADLGVEVEAEAQSSRTPREERIIAGFEDIERFFEQHGRPPAHGEERDIFERLYAVRLDKIRTSEECRAVLASMDRYGLLAADTLAVNVEGLDDDALLQELGVSTEGEAENDITALKHVRPRAEITSAEEIADRTPCRDFHKFKPLFEAVARDLKSGSRVARQIRKDAGFLKADVKKGEFFILEGQTLYIAEVGEPIKAPNGANDARLRVIYSNGTESNLLLRSLQRACYKDETSRIVSEGTAGPLFTDTAEEGDIESGTIYVLRSKSDLPEISQHREVIHKIGVTGSDVARRIGKPKLDPTYLMAEVEIIATYELSNINRTKLENLLHRFFEPARLDIEIKDRFGNPVVPREWFLVPLFVINEAVERVKNGTIVKCVYDPKIGQIIERAS